MKLTNNFSLEELVYSETAIKNGESVVIFPEVSDKGYLAELEGFHFGFLK